MVSEKFAEAFARFEEDVNVNRIKNFEQLRSAFGHWAGIKWIPTGKQVDALKDEARRLGIETRYLTREQQVRRIFWETSMAQQEKEAQGREKRFSKSYLSFQNWTEKTTRTTKYQQRVFNYMKSHPNSTLAEARGHKAKRSQ